MILTLWSFLTSQYWNVFSLKADQESAILRSEELVPDFHPPPVPNSQLLGKCRDNSPQFSIHLASYYVPIYRLGTRLQDSHPFPVASLKWSTHKRWRPQCRQICPQPPKDHSGTRDANLEPSSLLRIHW